MLPLGLVVLMLFMPILVAMTDQGDFFPWELLVFFTQAKMSLLFISFLLVILIGLADCEATYFLWLRGDQCTYIRSRRYGRNFG